MGRNAGRNDRIPESAYLKKPINKVCDSVIDLINKEAGVSENFKKTVSEVSDIMSNKIREREQKHHIEIG